MKKRCTDRGAKKRRSQQDLEKGERKAVKEKEAHAEPKLDNAKATFDAWIRKLIQQAYSPASIAKRLGITQRRIETAIQAEHLGVGLSANRRSSAHGYDWAPAYVFLFKLRNSFAMRSFDFLGDSNFLNKP